ncbi:MAG: hypothetical protein KGJ62_07025 [Armatimonadetes bacterium]|nr:hypothetical protein [Armatimonadota bacterium]MDE2207378.1 hypothetical protein [Armatimonadota bacterium]
MSILERAAETLRIDGRRVEIWNAPRHIPILLRADCLVAPVAPDLRMVTGASKLARDFGADRIQREAERVAPLEPGSALLGAGARYRFRWTALAVIFDENMTTNAQLVQRGLVAAADGAYRQHARSVILPDLTAHLCPSPNWLRPEQRAEFAELSARILAATVREIGERMQTVRIWLWDADSAGLVTAALHRHADGTHGAVVHA